MSAFESATAKHFAINTHQEADKNRCHLVGEGELARIPKSQAVFPGTSTRRKDR